MRESSIVAWLGALVLANPLTIIIFHNYIVETHPTFHAPSNPIPYSISTMMYCRFCFWTCNVHFYRMGSSSAGMLDNTTLGAQGLIDPLYQNTPIANTL